LCGNTICVGNYSTQTNTNNVNKIWTILLTTYSCLICNFLFHSWRFQNIFNDKYISYCVFCFVCFRLVSCVWWWQTHIVLWFWFCLSSTCFLCPQCCQFLWIVHPSIYITGVFQAIKYKTWYILQVCFKRLNTKQQKKTKHNMCWTSLNGNKHKNTTIRHDSVVVEFISTYACVLHRLLVRCIRYNILWFSLAVI
jgi:hypothetical protein